VVEGFCAEGEESESSWVHGPLHLLVAQPLKTMITLLDARSHSGLDRYHTSYALSHFLEHHDPTFRCTTPLV